MNTVIKKTNLPYRFGSSVLAVIGFILSPLSWWNDLLVNIPLAYAFSWPFTLLNTQLFLPAFIFGYWLTNIWGLIMLHKGVKGSVTGQKEGVSWRKDLLISVGYTLLISILVWAGWLQPPAEMWAWLAQ